MELDTLARCTIVKCLAEAKHSRRMTTSHMERFGSGCGSMSGFHTTYWEMTDDLDSIVGLQIWWGRQAWSSQSLDGTAICSRWLPMLIVWLAAAEAWFLGTNPCKTTNVLYIVCYISPIPEFWPIPQSCRCRVGKGSLHGRCSHYFDLDSRQKQSISTHKNTKDSLCLLWGTIHIKTFTFLSLFGICCMLPMR